MRETYFKTSSNPAYDYSALPKFLSKRRHTARHQSIICLIFTLFSTGLLASYLLYAIISGTRSNNAEMSTFMRKLLPAGNCLCESRTVFNCEPGLQEFPTSSIDAAGTEYPPAWEFQYGRDDQNLGLTSDQCDSAFPGLFEDLSRAVTIHMDNRILADDLDAIQLGPGMVRAMIFDGKLYVLETRLQDSDHRKKGVAILQSIYRSMSTNPAKRPISDIEFVFIVEDMPEHPSQPLWALARRSQDTNLWLMPDFGFWSWDLQDLGPFDEVVSQIERDEVEDDIAWENKIPKLFWRGKLPMAPKLRHALVTASQGKNWSDVEPVLTYIRHGLAGGNYVSAAEQCKYMFIAHAEGRSYSGSLKYRQVCNSIPVIHKLQWIQHHHYLLSSSGPQQNFVEVERDFYDLAEKMDYFLKEENLEEGKRIANNNVRIFRERYLTTAAEACYWRKLIKGWSEVSFEPERKGRGMRVENFVLLESEQQLNFELEGI